MPYLTQETFLAELPEEFQREATDDDRDAVADSGLFDTVLASAEEKVNAVIEAKGVTLPLTAPYPNPVKNATRFLVLEKLFARRGAHGEEKNPWTKDVAAALKLLAEWADDNSATTSGGDWGSETKMDL